MKSNIRPSKNDQEFEIWFKKHYLNLILGLLSIYSLLPVLAPVLMKIGFVFPAKLIYLVYSFFCHQYPFRSWFLFGVQPFYPLAETGITGIRFFETIFNAQNMDFDFSRTIIGNSFTGYKMAVCQRDFAMYMALLIFGLLYLFRDQKIKRIPFWVWVTIGLIPFGLDGLTQYIGNLFPSLTSNLFRESTPLIRTVTGGMFGFLSGWYIFPTLKLMLNKNILKIKNK